MTIVFEYRRTMAGAKFKIEPERPTSTGKRSALAELSLRWQERVRERELEKARAQVKTVAATELRLAVARQHAVFGLAILPPPLPLAIIEQVAFWHDVPMHDMMSACRTDRVVEARYDAIAAVSINCRVAGRAMSLTDIARAFGRDHTTILFALRHRGLRA